MDFSEAAAWLSRSCAGAARTTMTDYAMEGRRRATARLKGGSQMLAFSPRTWHPSFGTRALRKTVKLKIDRHGPRLRVDPDNAHQLAVAGAPRDDAPRQIRSRPEPSPSIACTSSSTIPPASATITNRAQNRAARPSRFTSLPLWRKDRIAGGA